MDRWQVNVAFMKYENWDRNVTVRVARMLDFHVNFMHPGSPWIGAGAAGAESKNVDVPSQKSLI